MLLEAARRYRATVTYKDLAIEVQRRSGIRTKQLMHHWIDEVLGRTALVNVERDEPLLCSLCVDDDERVGRGVRRGRAGGVRRRAGEPQRHAAKERLECYRFFEAVGLPADGGSVAPPKPATAPRTAAKRRRRRVSPR